jgi:hypothetical protein
MPLLLTASPFNLLTRLYTFSYRQLSAGSVLWRNVYFMARICVYHWKEKLFQLFQSVLYMTAYVYKHFASKY